MSEDLEETKEETRDDIKPSRGETILAKAKATTMVIGAIATACTAIWGAVRQPPEPGAKLAYDVLKEALQYERDRREKLEEEVELLKPKIETCYELQKQIKNEIRYLSLNNKSQRLPAVTVGSQESLEVIQESKPNQVSSKNRPMSPKLPTSKELGF